MSRIPAGQMTSRRVERAVTQTQLAAGAERSSQDAVLNMQQLPSRKSPELFVNFQTLMQKAFEEYQLSIEKISMPRRRA
jgi:hypothetical protein